MGLGDDLMITAFARQIKEKYPERQIVVGNKSIGKAYKSPIYINNPYITDSNEIDNSKPIHLIDYHNEIDLILIEKNQQMEIMHGIRISNQHLEKYIFQMMK